MIMRFALGHFPTSSHVCHSSLVHNEDNLEGNIIIPSINQIKKQWNEYSENNRGTGMAGQTFYFSFLSLMNIPRARNILEVGCGFGNLLPLAIMLKNQNATYLATDLVQNMVETSKINLKQNFNKYQSKLTFGQWCEKHHLFFKTANGEEIISSSKKFDRIICNCVLMITENPLKMLQSFYQQAQKGCLLGISVWGDEEKNPILKFITQIIKEEGEESSKVRSEFHLYKKVADLAQKIGWKLLLQWQQNALIPIIEFGNNDVSFNKMLNIFLNLLPESKRNLAHKRIIEKAHELLVETKEGLNFSTELYLFKKV